MIKSIKLAIACMVAIAIAMQFDLLYPTSAGIITILSVQNTKRETLQRAVVRGGAFLVALLISVGCFYTLGFHLITFSLYVLIFSFLCFKLGWVEAIPMSTVLVSHLWLEQSISLAILRNEIGLFIIGAGVGIFINLHLRKKEDEFWILANSVDHQIKEILERMAYWLLKEDKSDYKEKENLNKLDDIIEQTKRCAISNINNTFKKKNLAELDYIEMRENQAIVLREIYRNMKRIHAVPSQADEVASILLKLEKGFHKDNTAKEELLQLSNLYLSMKQQALPVTREEFETRALLFYILLEIRKLLELKSEYAESLTL